jgi:hypothetical protein
MGIRDRPSAAQSAWQNGHVERLIGSIRRECLDHVVVFGEAHLRQILKSMLSITIRFGPMSPSTRTRQSSDIHSGWATFWNCLYWADYTITTSECEFSVSTTALFHSLANGSITTPKLR